MFAQIIISCSLTFQLWTPPSLPAVMWACSWTLESEARSPCGRTGIFYKPWTLEKPAEKDTDWGLWCVSTHSWKHRKHKKWNKSKMAMPSSSKINKFSHCCGHLFLEAPSARMMGSVISIIDCRVDVVTMKRMMQRRKVRCRACMSNRPVWRASSSRVTPSVTPLTNHQEKQKRLVKRGKKILFNKRHLKVKKIMNQ